jgi:hypothetical protein
LFTVCAKGWLTRSVNIDWNDGRGAGGGNFSLAFAKGCVTPAVSGGDGIDAGGVGRVGRADGAGGAAEATRTKRSFGTASTRAVFTVVGGLLADRCAAAESLCASKDPALHK